MQGFGLGDLRLKPGAFWRLTWREYLIIADGWHRAQIRRYHHTRYLAAVNVNINRAKGTPVIEPSHLIWLPGDGPRSTGALSEEDFEATMARLAEFDTPTT